MLTDIQLEWLINEKDRNITSLDSHIIMQHLVIIIEAHAILSLVGMHCVYKNVYVRVRIRYYIEKEKDFL